MKSNFLGLLLIAVIVFSCEKDKENPPIDAGPSENGGSNVTVDLDQVPYPSLADYHFFQGALADMDPEPDVLPYDLISHLFTDYAKKNRYVWMPDGQAAAYVDDHQILDFPVGTVLIKTFYYDHVQPEDARRIMETRLLIRKEEQWIFAEYVWNEEQTEALLDMQGGYEPIEFIDDAGVLREVNYRLPSANGGECLFCHKKLSLPVPIGPKPQNLNKLMDYGSGPELQLSKWQDMGYLPADVPASEEILTVADWEDESLDLELRVRSYIDINCGHCHAEESHCDYRPMRFAFSETDVEENLGICVEPHEEIPGSGQTYIVSAAEHNRSMLYYRFSSVDEAERMPLLGRSIVHEEALEMIEEWIDQLDPPCN